MAEFEFIAQQAAARQLSRDTAANHSPPVQSEEMDPAKRFEMVWRAAGIIVGAETADSGGFAQVIGRTDSGASITGRIQRIIGKSPIGSLRPNRREIWVNWTDEEGEVIPSEHLSDTGVTFSPNDPEVLRMLALLEHSVDAAQELMERSPDQHTRIGFAA